MDETWVFHQDPESKQKAKKRGEPSNLAQQRFRVQIFVKKMLVFFGVQKIFC